MNNKKTKKEITEETKKRIRNRKREEEKKIYFKFRPFLTKLKDNFEKAVYWWWTTLLKSSSDPGTSLFFMKLEIIKKIDMHLNHWLAMITNPKATCCSIGQSQPIWGNFSFIEKIFGNFILFRAVFKSLKFMLVKSVLLMK